MKQTNGVRNVVAVAIGAAIFFVLMRFVQIPLPVPNTSLQTAYGFLALFAAVFGAVPAAIAGFIGHALVDLTYGSVWISWVLSTAIAGFGLGLVMKDVPVEQGEFNKKHKIRFIVGLLVVNLVAWALIAPSLDVLIYAEPANKVFVQGIVAALVNAFSTALIGWVLIEAYVRTRTKSGSLSEK